MTMTMMVNTEIDSKEIMKMIITMMNIRMIDNMVKTTIRIDLEDLQNIN